MLTQILTFLVLSAPNVGGQPVLVVDPAGHPLQGVTFAHQHSIDGRANINYVSHTTTDAEGKAFVLPMHWFDDYDRVLIEKSGYVPRELPRAQFVSADTNRIVLRQAP